MVEWSHNGDFGTIFVSRTGGFRIIVETVSERPNTAQNYTVPNKTARSYLVVGLVPYQYSSSSVQFRVSVRAFNSQGDSESSGWTDPIMLPRKLGVLISRLARGRK